MQTFVPMRGRTNKFVATLPTRPNAVRISGNGVPEGSIIAAPGAQYVDLLTGITWLKQQGVQKKGWVQNGTVGEAGVRPI